MAAPIIKAVKSCPSGALSYSVDGVEHRDQDREPVIFIAPNGPYATTDERQRVKALEREVMAAPISRVSSGVRARHASTSTCAGAARARARGPLHGAMRSMGLAGAVRGRAWVTTTRPTEGPRPTDLVDRNFTATRPNQLWVSDFTYVATWNGFVYTAFVVDVTTSTSTRPSRSNAGLSASPAYQPWVGLVASAEERHPDPYVHRVQYYQQAAVA